MNVTETKAEGLSRTFEFVVPAKDLQARLDAKIEEVRPQVRLKGFRPGKVPTSHIKKVFGESILGDVLEELMPKAVQDTMQERGLELATQPKIEVKSDPAEISKGGKDFEFEVSVEVMPEFEPADAKKMSVTRPVAEIEDAQVEEALAELAAQNKSYKEKTFDGGSATDARVAIGDGAFIPGFEEQLIGAKAGEERELKVTFPKDYNAKHLAGKEAIFETTVKSIEAPAETKIDDELAKNFGLEDLAALKDALKKRFEREHNSQSRLRAKRDLLDQLDAAHQFDLPPSMVEQEFATIWQEVSHAIEHGHLEDEDKDKSEDELKAEYRAIAERRVRLGLVLAKIGQGANVQVTQEEVSRAINAEAQKYPGQERQVVEFFQKNPNAVGQIRAPIYEEKVVDYILELAKVTDKKVSREALFEDEDEAPAKPAKNAAAKKAPAKKAAAKKDDAKADTKKAPAKKAATSKKDDGDKPAAKKKAPAKKAAAKKKS